MWARADFDFPAFRRAFALIALPARSRLDCADPTTGAGAGTLRFVIAWELSISRGASLKPSVKQSNRQPTELKQTTNITMMNSKRLLSCLAPMLLASSFALADTIAKWNFETNQPAGAPGAGVWVTNIAADIGAGTAAGWHAGSATYSSPPGNGSANSFSSAAWATGDSYQFAVSTIGFQNVTVAYDQAGSATGPRDFIFSYSTDGIHFTASGSSYIVLTNNTSANNEGSGKSTSAWSSSGSQQSAYALMFDLGSITSLDNQPAVYFRLTVADGTAENGASIGSLGADRVDNFLVSGAPLALSPSLTIQRAGNNDVKLTWSDSGLTLQSAPNATGTYTNIPGAASPYTESMGNQQKYYRLAQ
jgi:hypothetical protein